MSKPTSCDKCGSEFQSYKAMRVHQSQAGHMDKPWRNKDKLEKLYIGKKLSAYDIANKLNCGATAVYEALDDYGIDRRKHSESHKIPATRNPANYRTHSRDGYEEVYTSAHGNNQFARVHRLCAVAWFGYENVANSVVHHKIPIEWLNTEWNLEIKDSQSEHAKEHHRFRKRDEEGKYV